MSRIVYNMSNADYHAHPALGSTTLRRWLQSPLDAMTPTETTDAMRRGTLIHECLELGADAWRDAYSPPITREHEPERYEEIIATLPDKLADLRAMCADLGIQSARSADETRDRSALHKLNAAESSTIVDVDTYRDVLAAHDAAHAHPAVAAMLAASPNRVAESSIFWECERTGVECKCRPDLLLSDTGVIVDWKTTAHPSPSDFDRSAARARYHMQAAHYVDGVARAYGVSRDDLAFAFVVVPSSGARPESVTVRTLDSETIDRGLALRDTALDRVAAYRVAKESGTAWDGYADAPLPLSVPQWADRI